MKLHLTYEFESEVELRTHLAMETRADTSAPVDTITNVDVDADVTTRIATDVDADGMPYDAAVHSDPPQFTGDGLWRAKRGAAEAAKSARAAFKARGGALVAPVIEAIVAAAPELPGMPVAAPAMPVMPSVLPVSAPEPISLDRVIEKITGMMQRGVLPEATLAGLYTKHSGQADPTASFAVFNTNESARAGLFGELCLIEPELK